MDVAACPVVPGQRSLEYADLASPAWRVTRGVVLGTVPVGLAAAGHATAGGAVAAAPLLLLCVVSVAAALALFRGSCASCPSS